MKPFWKVETGLLFQGHVLDILKTIPNNTIQCCVTSPPYWGLRDYKIEPQIWDAQKECEHEWGEDIVAKQSGGGWAKGEEQKKRV